MATEEGFALACGLGQSRVWPSIGRPFNTATVRIAVCVKIRSTRRALRIFGSGGRIRTLTNGVRVRCATFTQLR